MKIVILSGSPHKHGTTSKLVDSFAAGANEAGHETVRFDVAFLDVHPCVACDTCQSSDDTKCVFQDDMVQIGRALAEAECVILATPIYYYGICAQLKTVIDRFYAIEPSIREKQKTAFITAMADDNPETVKAANDSYKAAINWLEWNDCGIVNAFGCTTAKDLEGTEYEAKAYELGKNI
jgi:multimeric flavodoxin WrbA